MALNYYLPYGWTLDFQHELAVFDHHVHNRTKLVFIGQSCFRSFPNRKFAINLSWKINAGLPSQVFSVLMRTGDCVLDSEPSLAADNTNGKREKSPEIEEKVPSAEARSSSSMKYCVLLSGLTTVRIHFFSFFSFFFKTLRLRRDDKIKVE